MFVRWFSLGSYDDEDDDGDEDDEYDDLLAWCTVSTRGYAAIMKMMVVMMMIISFMFSGHLS